MAHHSSDASSTVVDEPVTVVEADATDVSASGAAETEASATRSDRRRRDWRLGGRTVARWRDRVLGIAVLSLGLGLVISTTLVAFVAAPWAAATATAVLWTSMIAPTVWALSRSRPAGLLRLRAQDIIIALGLGLLLRMVQGWIDIAVGGVGGFPSYPTIGGSLGDGWWFTELLTPVVVAPLVEEFFFRAVVLVALYTLLRRAVGGLTAGIAAGLVSAGLFVLSHVLVGGVDVGDVLSLAVLGATCATVVLLTGRIWPAVLTHAVYNAAFVGLAALGTLAG